MGIRKEIPGGDLVTEYYNRIKAKTLAALLAYVPEDVNIPATCEETGRIYTYSNGAWWSGCHPIYANYPTANSKVFQVGDECLIPKLVGVGTIRLRYESTGRLAVDAGQCVASQNDPHSVISAASTTAVDLTWLTIPAGLIGDGEEWEHSFPSETGTNTGSDAITIIHGNSGVLYAATVSASTSGNITRSNRSSGIIARIFQSVNTSVVTGVQRSSIDSSVDQTLKLRITPATIGNTTYIRRAQLRRLS
jgi:hypothetical protein